MSNSRVVKPHPTMRQVQLDSELITFPKGVLDPAEVSSRLILMPKCPPQSITVSVMPPVPFVIEHAEFIPDSDDLDFNYVQVGNVILSAFAKRHRACDVGVRVTLQVSYRGEKELSTKVRLHGIGLVEAGDTSSYISKRCYECGRIDGIHAMGCRRAHV